MIRILEIFENIKNIRLNDIASNFKFSMLEFDRIELIETFNELLENNSNK